MLRISQNGARLTPIQRVLNEPLSERYDLRQLAFQNAATLFGEIGQRIFPIGADIRMGDGAAATVDILGLDPAGNLVLTYINRGVGFEYLSRTVRNAAAASLWTIEDIVGRLSAGRRRALAQFLEAPLDKINSGRRTILISEDFEFDVLLATRMLRERARHDVLAIHVSLALDYQTREEYLVCAEMSGSNLPIVVGIPHAEAAPGYASRALPGKTVEAPPTEQPEPTVKRPSKQAARQAAERGLAAWRPFEEVVVDGWRILGPEIGAGQEDDGR